KRQHGYVHEGVHINGIESFWSFAKRRLAKFNGVRRNFELNLKEYEWRWGKNEGAKITIPWSQN
ncbi:MAG: IS1595 family transposase, partial [Pseudomonadota bacterium]